MNRCFVVLLTILNLVIMDDMVLPQPSNQFEERLTYKMTYLGLSSARAEFLLQHSDNMIVPQTIRFVANVQTRGISDIIFRIRNHYESIIDTNSGLPVSVRKEIDQPNIQQSLDITFDHAKCMANSSQIGNWFIPPTCYDLFSMLNVLRQIDFSDDDSLHFVLDVESQLWQLSGQVEKPKPINTKLGKLTATHLKFTFHSAASQKPRAWKTDLLTNRIGREGAPLEIWLEDNPERTPLKLRFGSGFSAVEMNIIKREVII